MTRFFFAAMLLAALGFWCSAPAQTVSAQDQYLQIYVLILETDKLEASGQKATARGRYQLALDRLIKLREANRDWEPAIVAYRLKYCQDKINALQDAKDANPDAIPPVPVKAPPVNSEPPLAPADSQPPAVTVSAMTGADDEVQSLKKQLAELQTKLAATTEQLTQAQTEAATLRTKVAGLESSLATARDGTTDEKTAALLAENQKLTGQLSAAQATIATLQSGGDANSLVTLQEQLKKVQDQLALARQENEALRQTGDDYKARLAEAQKNLEAANARLTAAAGDSAVRQENLMLRDIIQREMAEQARREIAKRIALEELQNLAVNSDKLKAQIDLLGSPLTQLTDDERALLKAPAAAQPVVEVAADGGNFSAKRPQPADSSAVDYSTQAKVPTEFRDIARAANDFFSRQQYDEAAAQYQTILDQYPNSLYALSNLGVVRFQQQKYADAEKYLRQATSQAGDDAFAHSMLGITLYQEAKYDEAVQVLTRAAVLAPNDAKTHNYLGISASQKGWQEAAEQECRKAIELDPQYGDAHFNLAVIYATQNPPARELAKRHYERALERGIPRDEQLEKMIYAKDAGK
ncbi:MAG: tetratricopeptide repeat protein [Verrucomicrobiales bacterium]|jgi:Flp pilus assembly protein TadD|nr:tetratricopeptide repeat protein [Verrucomicrobiales bacterium]